MAVVNAHRFRMVRITHNSNGSANSSKLIPKELDPSGFFKWFFQRMERFATPQVLHHYPPPSQRPVGDKLHERFRALWLKNFDDVSEPGKAEQWLRGMDTIFYAFGM